MKTIVLDLETDFTIKEAENGKEFSDFGRPFNKGSNIVLWCVNEDGHYHVGHSGLGLKLYLNGLIARHGKIAIVAHNAKYEGLWLKALGIDLSKIKFICTQVREYLIGCGQYELRHTGLDVTAPRYGGTTKNDIIGMYFKAGIGSSDIPNVLLERYCVADVGNTTLIYNGQLQNPDLQRQWQMVRFMEDVLVTLIEMEYAGLSFNVDELPTVRQELDKKAAEAERRLMKAIEAVCGAVTTKGLIAEFEKKGKKIFDSAQAMSRIIYSREVRADKKADFKAFAAKWRPTRKYATRDLEKALAEYTTKLPYGAYVKPSPSWLVEAQVVKNAYIGKTGFSANAKLLEAFKEHGDANAKQLEIIEAFLEYNKIDNWRTTSLQQILKGIADDGLIHPSFNQLGTVTGRFSSSNPNCFPLDITEVLTPQGWVPLASAHLGGTYAGFDTSTGNIVFETPKSIIRDCTDTVVHIRTDQQIDLQATADHDMLLQDRKTGKWIKRFACETPEDYRLYHAAPISGAAAKRPLVELQTMLMFQADGHRRKQDGIVEFSFTKKRKIARCKQLLEAQGIPYRTRRKNSEQTCVSVSRLAAPAEWSKLLLQEDYIVSPAEAEVLFEEAMFWDGCVSRQSMYCSEIAQNAEVVQLLALQCGRRAKIRVYKGKYYQVDVVKKPYSLTTNRRITRLVGEREVGCLSMPSGNLVIKQYGKVYILGNCQNFPREGTVALKKLIKSRFKDGVIVQADYGQLEFRVVGMIAGDNKLIEDVNNDFDIHSNTAKIAYKDKYGDLVYVNVNGGTDTFTKPTVEIIKGYQIKPTKEQKPMRQKAKNQTFKFQYGGMPVTEEAKAIFGAFYGKYLRVASWQEDTVARVGTKKEYVCPSTGRVFAFPDASLDNTVKFSTKVKNYPVQFLSAVVTQSAQLLVQQKIVERGKDDMRLVLQVHDSLVIDCKPEAKKAAAKILKESMEGVTVMFQKYFGKEITIPLTTDLECGSTYLGGDKI